MLRRLIPFVLLSAVPGTADAAALPDAGTTQSAPVKGLQLAQNGDVQIFYDEYGRRVILDTFTGEVVAVEEPNARNEAPWESDRRAVGRGNGRPDLNDPYQRDLYTRETGRAPVVRDSEPYDIYVPDGGGEPYPLTRDEAEPTYANRGIERRPLDNGFSEPPPAATGSPTPPAATDSLTPPPPVA